MSCLARCHRSCIAGQVGNLSYTKKRVFGLGWPALRARMAPSTTSSTPARPGVACARAAVDGCCRARPIIPGTDLSIMRQSSLSSGSVKDAHTGYEGDARSSNSIPRAREVFQLTGTPGPYLSAGRLCVWSPQPRRAAISVVPWFHLPRPRLDMRLVPPSALAAAPALHAFSTISPYPCGMIQ